MTPKELGKIFKEKREGLGLTIEKAHLRSKIHPNVIADIENGQFDRLAKVYMRSFVKKYAFFLGLDQDDLVKKFESLNVKTKSDLMLQELKQHAGIKEPRQTQQPRETRTIRKEKETQPAGKRKIELKIPERIRIPGTLKIPGDLAKSRIFLGAILSVAVLAIILFAVKIFTGSGYDSIDRPAIRTEVTAAQANMPVRLELEAAGDVWVEVIEGDRKIFAVVMKQGEKKLFTSQEGFKVNTGKGENLLFTLNGRRVGRAVNGVVKGIDVSSQGIRLGNKWVSSFN